MNLLNNASSCTVYLAVDLAIKVMLLPRTNLAVLNFRISQMKFEALKLSFFCMMTRSAQI